MTSNAGRKGAIAIKIRNSDSDSQANRREKYTDGGAMCAEGQDDARRRQRRGAGSMHRLQANRRAGVGATWWVDEATIASGFEHGHAEWSIGHLDVF